MTSESCYVLGVMLFMCMGAQILVTTYLRFWIAKNNFPDVQEALLRKVSILQLTLNGYTIKPLKMIDLLLESEDSLWHPNNFLFQALNKVSDQEGYQAPGQCIQDGDASHVLPTLLWYTKVTISILLEFCDLYFIVVMLWFHSIKRLAHSINL